MFFTAACHGCTLLEDTFDADNLATEYDQRAGSWSVSGGVASVSSANALLVTQATNDNSAVFAKSYVVCSSVNEAARVVIGYVDDDNYWFAEVQAGSTFGGTLKLFQRVGGSNFQRGVTVPLLTIAPPGGGPTACGTGSIDGHLLLCAHDGIVSAYFCCGTGFCFEQTNGQITGSFTWMIQYDAGSFPENTKAGIGTGAASAAVTFDNFRFADHFFIDQDCLHCHYCPRCRSMANELQITIAGLTGSCAAFNGTYTVRRQSFGDNGCQWSVATGWPGTITVSMTNETKLEIVLLKTTGLRVDAITDSLATPAGSPTDCASWNSLNVPNITSNNFGGLCDVSTASIYVTAL